MVLVAVVVAFPEASGCCELFALPDFFCDLRRAITAFHLSGRQDQLDLDLAQKLRVVLVLAMANASPTVFETVVAAERCWCILLGTQWEQFDNNIASATHGVPLSGERCATDM